MLERRKSFSEHYFSSIVDKEIGELNITTKEKDMNNSLQWQNKLLIWLPIELIKEGQEKNYHMALNTTNTAGESMIFVNFMLYIIRDT